MINKKNVEQLLMYLMSCSTTEKHHNLKTLININHLLMGRVLNFISMFSFLSFFVFCLNVPLSSKGLMGLMSYVEETFNGTEHQRGASRFYHLLHILHS